MYLRLRRVTAGMGAASLLSMTLATAPATATDSWSPNSTLSATGSTALRAPRLVVSADGTKAIAAWVRRISATTGVVQVARSSDGGATWTAAANVTVSNQDIDQPQIAAADDLSKVVVFWLVRNGGTSTIQNSTSPDGGLTWPSPSTVTTTMSDVGSFDIASSKDASRLHVAWQAPAPGNYTVIEANSSSNSGGTWAGKKSVSPASGLDAGPRVTTGADGTHATIAWNHKFSADPSTVASSSTTNTGQNWSAPKTLSTAGSSSSFQTDLAASDSGTSIAATWQQWDAQTKRTVRVATSQNAGGAWAPALVISPEGVDTNTARILSATDGGRLVVLWGTPQGVFARVRPAAGADWGPTTQIGSAGDQIRIAGSSDAMTLIAAWRRSPTASIAVATSADGGLTWTESSGPAAAGGENPDVAAATDGQRFAAVWALKPGAAWLTQAARGPSVAPDASVSPSSLDFGDLPVGSTADRTVTVTNTGLGLLKVAGTTLTGSDRFSVVANTCSSPILPGAACQVSVRLTPNAATSFSGSLVLGDNTATGTRSVGLAGTGSGAGPTPTVKQVQKPVNGAGLPPKAIKKKGSTVITGRNALTNAGQQLQTVVKVTAKKKQYRIVRGKQGKVSIRTFGTKPKRITVTQTAPENSQFLEYRLKTVYRKGKRA